MRCCVSLSLMVPLGMCVYRIAARLLHHGDPRFHYVSYNTGSLLRHFVCLGPIDGALQTAARLVGRIPRFNQVSVYMRDVLNWLPYQQRIAYLASALVRRCIRASQLHRCGNSVAPLWLFSVVSHCALHRKRSNWTPIHGLFSASAAQSPVACPTTWNGLIPIGHSVPFFSGLRTILFDRGWAETQAGRAPE